MPAHMTPSRSLSGQCRLAGCLRYTALGSLGSLVAMALGSLVYHVNDRLILFGRVAKFSLCLADYCIDTAF